VKARRNVSEYLWASRLSSWCRVGVAAEVECGGTDASGAEKRVSLATEEGAGRPRGIDAASSSSCLYGRKVQALTLTP